MISFPIVIDGVTYEHIHVNGLSRNFQIVDKDNAGRTLSGVMERDIVGTYYNYTLEIDPSEASPQEYDAMYEVVSAPQEYHTIVVPYAQTVLTYRAYCAQGKDRLIYMGDTRNRWGEMTFDFVAMEPQRR